jgi:hypothetical protein
VPESAGTGVGLQNVRRRLQIYYGPAAHLRLTIGTQKSLAELEIPWWIGMRKNIYPSSPDTVHGDRARLLRSHKNENRISQIVVPL